MPTITQVSPKTKTYIKIGVVLAIAVGIGLIGYFFGFVPATEKSQSLGKLEPDTPPGGVSYSLEDIYNKLVQGKEADLGQKKAAPASGPSDTMVTLESIYRAVPSSDKICQGTNAGKAKCESPSTSVPTPTVSPSPSPSPTTPTPVPSAKDNLIVWLPFDEAKGSKFYDQSNQKNNGQCILAGAQCPNINQSGRVGKAVEFDGIDDYITLVKNLDLVMEEGITVEAWINLKEKPKDEKTGIYDKPVNPILNLGSPTISPSSGFHFFSVSYYNNKSPSSPEKQISWSRIRKSDVKGQLVTKSLSKFFSFDFGKWYHLMASLDYQTREAALSIDGYQTRESDSGYQVVPISNQTVYIGGIVWGALYKFKGLIDELRIYNRALTADEAEAEYESYSAYE